MKPRGRCRSRTGLTLVEVMLAVTILGLGLVVLLTAASRCLALMRRAKTYQDAMWTLSRGEVDFPLIETNELAALNVPPERYPNGLVFSREAEEDEDEDGLCVIRSRVTWSDKGRDCHEEVVRYLYRPVEAK